MINAKKELLKHLQEIGRVVICFRIDYDDYSDGKRTVSVLKMNHTSEEFNDALDKLDSRYDNGYGLQELYGTIWHADGTWSERREYDGEEWWEHCFRPQIPEDCKE